MSLEILKPLIEQGNQNILDIGQKQVDLEARIAEIETKANRPGAARQAGGETGLQIEAKRLRTFLEDGTGLERKDILSQGTGAQGGFALPEEISRLITDQLISISPIRSIARVVQTTTSDYRALVGVRGTTTAWNGEGATRGETETPEMAEVAPTSGELWAYPTVSQFALDDPVSQFALDDLIFNTQAWLQLNVTDAFAQAEGQAFVTGNGTDKPTGFLTGTPVATADATRAFGTLQYIATGDASALGSAPQDKLVDMIYTLKSGYRGNARFVMNSKTAGDIRKLKDADGRFLWTDGLAMGQPATLLGYAVVIAEDMPDVAANTFPIAFGDFQRGYLITERTGLRIIRDEITKPGFVRYLISKRVGGKLLDTNAIKLLKVAAS